MYVIIPEVIKNTKKDLKSILEFTSHIYFIKKPGKGGMPLRFTINKNTEKVDNLLIQLLLKIELLIFLNTKNTGKNRKT